MTTWAEFCAGGRKDSQSVLSVRLSSGSAGKGGGCYIVRCNAVFTPSASHHFSSHFQVIQKKFFNVSLAHSSVLEVRNPREGLVTLGTVEDCHFSVP
jgi:hypothetical protein